MLDATIDRRHDTNQSAEVLTGNGFPIASATLRKLRCVGGGPPFEFWGRRPLYREADLLSWAEARCSKQRRSIST
jgi:hypothetical protein